MVLLRLAMNLGGSYGIKDFSIASLPDPGFREHALRLLLPGVPEGFVLLICILGQIE